MVDALANEALLSKFYNEAYNILEKTSNNNYQWSYTKQVIVRGTVEFNNVML